MKATHRIIAAGATLLVALSLSTPAYGISTEAAYDAKLDALSRELAVPATREQTGEYVHQLAEHSGITSEQVVDYLLADARGELPPAIEPRSGGGDRKLSQADAVGDFFYTDSWSGPVNHGHTGIYVTKDEIVEAPGPGQVARRLSVNEKMVYPGAVLRSVKAWQIEHGWAAKKAESYIGRGYNSAFYLGNKDENGGMHCAQLVWAAWRFGAGLDIDTGRDNIVWPWDLRDTNKAVTYRHI